MKLIVIFGPPAVGKMTVGLELQRRTGLRLFQPATSSIPSSTCGSTTLTSIRGTLRT